MIPVHEQHRSDGEGGQRCAVITCSDTRTSQDDTSGALIHELLVAAGHQVVSYEVVREDAGNVAAALERAASGSQIILLTGGTGISPRDGTVEAVQTFASRELPGFGELFRSLSYEEIGAAAMLSRATAALRGNVVVFAMPGSTAAVRLAMTRLIIPELGHIAGLLG